MHGCGEWRVSCDSARETSRGVKAGPRTGLLRRVGVPATEGKQGVRADRGDDVRADGVAGLAVGDLQGGRERRLPDLRSSSRGHLPIRPRRCEAPCVRFQQRPAPAPRDGAAGLLEDRACRRLDNPLLHLGDSSSAADSTQRTMLSKRPATMVVDGSFAWRSDALARCSPGRHQSGRGGERVDRRVVEGHPAVAGAMAIDGEVRPGSRPGGRTGLLLEAPASTVLMGPPQVDGSEAPTGRAGPPGRRRYGLRQTARRCA